MYIAAIAILRGFEIARPIFPVSIFRESKFSVCKFIICFFECHKVVTSCCYVDTCTYRDNM